MSRRREAPKITTHHLVPRSRGGDNSPENLSKVRDTEHRAWHTLFRNWSPCEIAMRIMGLFIPKDFSLTVKREGGCKDCPWKNNCMLRK